MNTGDKFSVLLDAKSNIKRGDLFRVIEVTETNRITLAAIDDACLRDDEEGARTKKRKKPEKPKKRPQSPAQERQNQRARVAWKRRSVLECLAIIDKEEEER